MNHVNELNLRLKEKILEFQSFNQHNVDSAKTHIAKLASSLDEKVKEIKDRQEREAVLESKIKKMEMQWRERASNSQ